MKKILFILSLFATLVVTAQTVPGYTWRNVQERIHAGIANAWNGPIGDSAKFQSGQWQMPGAYYLDTLDTETSPAGFYISKRASDGTLFWERQSNPPSVCQDELINPVSIVYMGTGYDWIVAGGGYYINCVQYPAVFDTLTNEDADTIYDRYDAFYVDATGVHIRAGEPSELPIIPSMDLGEILVGWVRIPANDSVPDLSQIFVYNENIEGWTVTQSGTTINADATNNPWFNAKSIEVTNVNNGDYIRFKRGAGPVNLASTTSISFGIDLKAAMSGAANLVVRLWNNGIVVSDPVRVPLNKNLTVYQPISMALSLFNRRSDLVDSITIQYTHTTSPSTVHSGFWLDNIHFVTGLIQTGGGGGVNSVVVNDLGNAVGFDENPAIGDVIINPVAKGTANQWVDGTLSLRTIDFFRKIGAINTYPKVTNGIRSSADTAYGQEADSVYHGFLSPNDWKRFDSATKRTAQSDGNGIPILVDDPPFNTKFRSIVLGEVWGFTDSTILIDTTGGNLAFDTIGAAGISPVFARNDSLLSRRLSVTGGLTINTTASEGLVIDASGISRTLQQVADAGNTSTTKIFINGTTASDGMIRGVNASTSSGSYGVYGSGTGSGGIGGGGGVFGVSTTGTGVHGQTTTGMAVSGITAGAGIGGFFESDAGIALSTLSLSDYAGNFRVADASTNSVKKSVNVMRSTTGTAAAGLGVSVDFSVESTTTDARISNQLISKWVDATDVSRTSEFDITGVDNTTSETFMNIQKDLVRINNNADTLATRAYARSVGGGGGSTPTNINDIGDATSAGLVTVGNNSQQWDFTGLTGSGLLIQSSTTAASSNLHKVLRAVTTGANASSSVRSFAFEANNTHTGTGSVNVGATFSASGGDANHAILVGPTNGNVGFGTTDPVASSILELSSTTRGFLAPRMNTTQQNAISSPATGLLIYNTDSALFRYYNGSAWASIAGGTAGGGGFTQEEIEDFAAGLFTTDNGDIDFTYNDGTPDISAQIKAGTIVNADINSSAAIDATKLADGSVTNAELQYINTLSSNAQTQIDGKQTKSFGIIQAATYTLSNVSTTQKLFDASYNGGAAGEIPVSASTTYLFECNYYISSMSGTSGNAGFDVLGAGTATVTSVAWWVDARDALASTPAGASKTFSPNTAETQNLATASSATGMYVTITGVIRINASGTIIPSINLTNAAAAVVAVNSYFKLTPIGNNTATYW